jgi:multiple sugar transport system substrate-binding protein
MSWRCTRRSVVQAGLWSAAAVARAAARATSPLARALPRAVRTKTVLIAEVSWQGGVNYVPTVKALVDDFLAREWSSLHPGVEVQTWGWRGDPAFLNGTAAIAAVLAGSGPDILMTCCNEVPVYIDTGVVQPLDPFIKRDNLDVAALFPAGVMQSMRTDEGTFGFPDYGSTQPLFYNQSMLDELGLPYPESDWTYEEAERLWRAIAGSRQGKWVYGANLPTEADGSGDWLVHAFGGHARDATQTRCLLDSPEVVRAYAWLASLTVPKVVYGGLWGLGITPRVVFEGTAAFSPACCGTLQWAATILGTKIKWDLIPMPIFPAGPVNFIGNGFYGINANTKNDVDLVWDLFKFITTTRKWQLFFNAQLALQPPILLDPGVWDDWMEIVQRVAPPLRGKHLEYYRTALPYAYDWAYFKYAPAQADAIWTRYEGMILSGKLSAAEGLRLAAQQIDALEAEGPAIQRDQAAQLQQARRLGELVAVRGGSGVVFPQPPVRDPAAGVPPSPAPGAVTMAPSGAVTLRARGAGGLIGTSDNCVFAGAPYTAATGQFTCRLTSVTVQGATTLPAGAKIGLMARASLSNSAAMVAILFAGDHGVLAHDRPLDDLNFNPVLGIVPASAVQASAPPVGGNWLLKPIWFRLVLSGTTWRFFWSWDGQAWTQAAGQQEVDWVGSWVGLFATSHSATAEVEATFDHLAGFGVSTVVQIGTP